VRELSVIVRRFPVGFDSGRRQLMVTWKRSKEVACYLVTSHSVACSVAIIVTDSVAPHGFSVFTVVKRHGGQSGHFDYLFIR
jgi:hypothetical protein